ncbi:MAG: hypothetical protein L0154_04530, partial [Chloroflexi bacterium]|nr:hypothetical protein [Chloroflexota bacterium]
MDELFSFPVGMFLMIWGVLWQPQPPTPADDEFFEDVEPSQEEKVKFLRRVATRVLMLVVGFVITLVALFSGPGTINDPAAFLLFFVIYGGSLLVLQRSESTQRMIVFFIVVFAAFFVWRYALYRDFRGEHNWGLLASLDGYPFEVRYSENVHAEAVRLA